MIGRTSVRPHRHNQSEGHKFLGAQTSPVRVRSPALSTNQNASKPLVTIGDQRFFVSGGG